MLHLVDFSDSGFKRYNLNSDNLQEFLSDKGLDGFEYFLNTNNIAIPADTIKSVELAYNLNWLDEWYKERRLMSNTSFSNLVSAATAGFKGSLIYNLHSLITKASLLDVPQAVVNAGNVDLENMFTRKYTYSSAEVLGCFSDLLNICVKQLDEYEPKCTLAIKNTSWPGLDFTSAGIADDFAAKLEFNNWNLALDLGQIINTNPYLRCEDEAIDYVLENLSKLSYDILSLIKTCIVSMNISGSSQLKYIRRGLPFDWAYLSAENKYKKADMYNSEINQYRAFESSRLREIIGFLNLDIVVHKIYYANNDEYSSKLRYQKSLCV